jgi:hypothetical protein
VLYVLPLLLVFAALLATLTVVIMRITGRALGRTIADRVHAAEYIQRTGKVPPAWISVPASSTRPRDARRIHAEVLKRLDELCRYYERAPVPEDAGAHAVVLLSLRKTRAEWANREIDSLILHNLP